MNKVMKKFMSGEVQEFSIDHGHNITAKEINLFRIDGTHMSILGNQLFFNDLQAAMQSFLQNCQTSSPTK